MEFINEISKTLGIQSNVIGIAILAVVLLLILFIFVILFLLVLRAFSSGGREKVKSEKKPKPEKVKVEKPKNEKKKRGHRKNSESVPSASPTADAVPTAEAVPVQNEAGEDTAVVEPVSVSASVAEPSDAHLEGVADLLISQKSRDAEQKKDRSLSLKSKKRPSYSAMRSGRQLKKKATKLKIPKSAQDSIPYRTVYAEDGIIETEPGVFTKSYLLDDVNYQVAKDEEQAEMFLKYGEFINSFDPTTQIQLTINQRNLNMEEFERDTMLPLRGDNLDGLRTERNELLKKKMLEGKNNLVKEKYVTISVQATDYASAKTVFARLDSEIVTNIKKIGGAGAQPLSSSKRLEILHDIYNLGSEGMFGNNMIMDVHGNLVFDKDKFSFDIMRRMGLSTKDMIAPDSFTFKSDYGMLGDKYFRALFMRKIPSFLGDNVLAELTDTELNMITSLILQPIESEKALKMARSQITNINANMVEKQKQASKSGYSVELISPELRDAAEEANELFRDLTGKNQKLFFMTLAIVHFADTKEELDSATKAIQTIGRRLMVDIKKLSWQQENGLATVVPLCNNKLQIKRSLTTESASVFMPFVNQELVDRNGGMYYGNNAVSHNLIMLNRRNSKNGNGFIFGTPGSGKSMSAKQEMMTVLLSSSDEVIVIDPEGEYYPMAELLGGEVIRIAAGSNVHINPFDIDMHYDSDDDPITIKSDFIVSLCETVIGERYGLNASQRSLIDRCVKKVYEPFLGSRDPVTGEYDKRKLPTLLTFYEALRAQSGYDAMQLADGLEIYVTGSMNVFAHKTNVEYSKRFVVYDIKDIGSTMKSMGLLVVLDNIWNRIVAGRKEGRNVWFFIDEIYLLFKTQSSADFLRQLYKRARKYGGLPTGITQNVSDLLENDIARTMISNCEYIQMLNQAPLDRAQLGQLLNISPTQLSYITNSNPGEGLIYDGSHIVPFVNTVPKDTMQYRAMTSKLSEVREREEAKKAQAATAPEASHKSAVISGDC